MWARWADFDRTFAAIDELRRRMDRGFDEFAPPHSREEQLGWAGRGAWPRANVYDVGSNVLVQAELPGMSEKEIGITLHQEVLTLTGERSPAAPEGYKALRKERVPVRFSRSIALPCKVDTEKTVASLKDGVLTITLTKAVDAQPRQISIRAQ